MTSRAAIKDPKLLSFTGLLQPVSSEEKELGQFKLVTQGEVYFLSVPESLMPYLKRHLWEDFYIQGEVMGKSAVRVKKARMHDELFEELQNENTEADLGLIEHQLHQGQPLEPRDLDGI